jgi:hypothetical protein
MSMALDTDRLIATLAAHAKPVRRLRPPMMRASLWLLLVAAIAGTAILFLANWGMVDRRMSDPKLQIEMAGTLLTGFAAVIAAFHLSLPDRPGAWALLPLPPFVLWVASSSYSCWKTWIVQGPGGWSWGHSAECFNFIVGVSVPLGLCLGYVLSRAKPLAPILVAATGGLGVAALGAVILQFFHPFDVTFLDLGTHLVAVGLVVLIFSGAGRFWRV